MLFTAFHVAAIAGFAVERHDPYVHATPVVEWSFDADEDRDFDDQPDDWTRRRGPGFPRYVHASVERGRGRLDKSSLRFEANGGRAAFYSPKVRIDDQYTFLFEGYVRTQALQHDAGLVTVSFLNHAHERVAEYRSRAVTGTHSGWVRIRVGPMRPPAGARFAVVACHLVPRDRHDFRGVCWFDDLRLLRTPRLTLTSNYDEQFVDREAGVLARAFVGGVEDEADHRVKMSIRNAAGAVVVETERPLAEATRVDPADSPDGSPRTTSTVSRVLEWATPPQEYGFYTIHAVLLREGVPVLEERTSFAVVDLEERRKFGEFGWSALGPEIANVDVDRFANVVSQAGVHWVKHPVWKLSTDGSQDERKRVSRLFAALQQQHVRVVGVFQEPPAELRGKFADDWTGVAEVLSMPPDVWAASLDPVLADYASEVAEWQLGGDDDGSFVGLQRLDEVHRNAKKAVDRIGRNSRIGFPWTWRTERPSSPALAGSFFSLLENDPVAAPEFEAGARQSSSGLGSRWVVLKPLGKSGHALDQRAADLVKRMVVARVAGVDAVFAYDVFDEEHGLLNGDGSPRRLFLPWRTTANALTGATYLGRMRLPGRSVCHAFARDEEGILVVWNESSQAAESGVEEQVFLGEEAYVLDVWGRPTRLGGRNEVAGQTLVVGPEPQIVRGLSAGLLGFRLSVHPENVRFDSSTARQSETFRGVNAFDQGVNATATLVLPEDWEAEPREWKLQLAADEPFELKSFVELPPNATLGDVPVAVDFEVVGDRPYRFRVHHDLHVGLDELLLKIVDRRLPDGRLEIEQVTVNKTDPVEVLDLDCTLFVPGAKRQRQYVTKLGRGEDRRIYHVPNADAHRGQEFWVRARQVRGRRVLNYRWIVGENWDEESADEARVTSSGEETTFGATDGS